MNEPSSKHEIRNSKQARMSKIQIIQTKYVLGFGNSDFGFVSDFDIRISDL